jgi:hypothetical protein
VSTVAHVTRIPAVAAEDRATTELIATLDRRGITRVYADYPICNQLTFRTGERIVCAVVGGTDRYPRFRRMVDAAPDAVFVVQVDGRWQLLPRS